MLPKEYEVKGKNFIVSASARGIGKGIVEVLASSGANVLAAERWIEKNNPTGVVVTFLCDRGERYLSCM